MGRSIAAKWSVAPERVDEETKKGQTRGLLFASGLITGEALVGILLAIPFAASQSTDVLALAPEGFEAVANILGIIGFALFCFWLFRTARGSRA